MRGLHFETITPPASEKLSRAKSYPNDSCFNIRIQVLTFFGKNFKNYFLRGSA
jgi:hypothetical protein